MRCSQFYGDCLEVDLDKIFYTVMPVEFDTDATFFLERAMFHFTRVFFAAYNGGIWQSLLTPRRMRINVNIG